MTNIVLEVRFGEFSAFFKAPLVGIYMKCATRRTDDHTVRLESYLGFVLGTLIRSLKEVFYLVIYCVFTHGLMTSLASNHP